MPTGQARSVRTTTLLGAGVAALALVGGLAACSSSDDKASSNSSSSTDAHKANVTVSAAKGCETDNASFKAGSITFAISNKDATAVSEVELLSGERIVGEKENLPPGFSGSFVVSVDAGKYTLYCPGASPERSTITVTGTAATSGNTTVSALLATGSSQYAAYVNNQMTYLVTTSEKLQTAIAAGDLTAAQKAYVEARPYYEKIEPVAESFTVGKDDLDAAIDARENDVASPSQWTGFHRIEKGLYQDKSLTGLNAYATGLVANVKKLKQLTTGLTYKPFELANGGQELLDEVSSGKITGEEERYSHIDLLDFQGNDEGAEQAFACLQPALTKIDATLTARIGTAFTQLNTLVDSYRSNDNPSGFKLYSQLTVADKKQLAAAVKAVQEPLSQVAAKVSNA
jgi:iron uptake system component EfeO